jgi:hypothetical protein
VVLTRFIGIPPEHPSRPAWSLWIVTASANRHEREGQELRLVTLEVQGHSQQLPIGVSRLEDALQQIPAIEDRFTPCHHIVADDHVGAAENRGPC